MNKLVFIVSRSRSDKGFLERFLRASIEKFYATEIEMDSERSRMQVSKRLLRNYVLQCENVYNESSLAPVPTSVKSFLLPYLRHIQSIDNTAYCLNSLFVMNEPRLANSTLHRKLINIMETLRKDLNGLTDDLIFHLTMNDATDSEEKNDKKVAEKLNPSTPNTNDNNTNSDEEWQAMSQLAETVCNQSSSTSKRKLADNESLTKRSKKEYATNRNNSSISASTLVTGNYNENSRGDHHVSMSKNNSSMLASTSGSDLKFNERGQLMVFIDGACFSNGRTIAKAGYGVWFNYNHPLNVSAPIKGVPTNNNAEIQAATCAILQAHSIGVKKIKLHTDSQFLINCMTQWIHKWKRNNWMTTNKQPVKNKESLMELDGVMPLMDQVEWEHVEAHVGIPGNEEADELAKRGATMYKTKRSVFEPPE